MRLPFARPQRIGSGIGLLSLFFLPVSRLYCALPTFPVLPVLSSATVVADGATHYSVTMTARDTSGYDDLKSLRVLFNYTEAEGDTALGRGYLAWGQTDADMTSSAGTWVTEDAVGGGRWGYRTDAWGGTQYLVPDHCEMTATGAATGGAGSRTVTWTFTAQPAWALDPVINDGDAIVTYGVSSRVVADGTAEFDVVGSACAAWADTPGVPQLFRPTSTTLDVAVNPADSATDLFAIRASPPFDSRAYVQVDGTIGPFPVWRTKSSWGTVTVAGLLSGTVYTFQLKARDQAAGSCPSGFGPGAVGATLVQSRTIHAGASGVPISRGVMGNATRLDAFSWGGDGAIERIWDVVGENSVRGIAGGMDADTYNWKDMSGQGVGHAGTPGPTVPTTLMWMRSARDYGPAISLVAVNTRGTGPLASSGWCTFYYTNLSLAPLVTLAADWVRYVNVILPAYRQGETLPPADQSILDSIDWYGRPKLLDPGEAPTPRVTYWEIGNEPELTLPWCTPDVATHTVSPSEYVYRYKQITAAMLAVDPTIKVGPCTIGETHSGAVLGDPAAVVDFVSYHPYGPLYWFANNYGDTPGSAESGLRYVRRQQVERCEEVRNNILLSGRNPDDVLLVASEWNPSDWQWECSGKDRRMSHALGVADTILTFGELGLFAAHYWSFPTSCSSTPEAPGYMVFQMMLQHLGDRLLDSYDDGWSFRMYTTLDTARNDIAVWGLNFSDSADKVIRLGLSDTTVVRNVTVKRLANPAGDTGLFDRNDSPSSITVDWAETDITGVDLEDFTVTFEDATITIIIVDQAEAFAEGFEDY